MFQSGEVRWFFRGKAAVELHRWFETGGCGRDEPERTDDYLLLPGCEAAGVKLRDGRLEIKARTSSPTRTEFTGGIGGWCDTWVKWSSHAGNVTRFRSQIVRPEDNWLSVTKKRYLRLFSLESDEPAEIAVGQSWLSRGCQVELTDIGVRPSGQEGKPAAAWWSLSFESFGQSDTLLESLDLVVPVFFVEAPPVTLDYDSSYSYPAWLNRLD